MKINKYISRRFFLSNGLNHSIKSLYKSHLIKIEHQNDDLVVWCLTFFSLHCPINDRLQIRSGDFGWPIKRWNSHWYFWLWGQGTGPAAKRKSASLPVDSCADLWPDETLDASVLSGFWSSDSSLSPLPVNLSPSFLNDLCFPMLSRSWSSLLLLHPPLPFLKIQLNKHIEYISLDVINLAIIFTFWIKLLKRNKRFVDIERILKG